MKRLFSLALCCLLLLGLAGCGGVNIPFLGIGDGVKQNRLSDAELDAEGLSAASGAQRAAVLYDGSASGEGWRDAYSRLAQPLLLGLEAEAVDISGAYSLEGFDLLYPDESVMAAANADALRDEIAAFAEAGGGVFLTNGFYDFFDLDFFGAKSFEELVDYPYGISFPEVGDDLAELQGIIGDFFTLYEAYADFGALEGLPRGVGMKPGSAVALAVRAGQALFAVNEYGAGYVLFCSALLPNPYCISGTDMVARSEEQGYFADTSMSAARLLENGFAAFCAKRERGFAVWRVFGSFGAPAMSWELHFEEMTGFANGSGVAFAELCAEYDQIPSYTLIRSSYTWFLRAESVTTLLGEGEGVPRYTMDLNESAYSSGTHVAAGDAWLSLGEIENGGSYFSDRPEYDLRAYPCVADLDGDGLLDLVCGAADGGLWFFAGTGYTDRLTTEAGVPLTGADGAALAVSGYSAPVLADLDGDGFADILCGDGAGRLWLFAGGEDGFAAGRLWRETGLAGQCLPDLGDLDGDGLLDLVVGSNEGRVLLARGLEGGGFGAFEALALFGVEGDWLAPRVTDLDGDGAADLAVGTFDGYIARFVRNADGSFSNGGFIELDERNYKGNYNAKFGNNCAPFFADINGDGVTDLVCGCLEYGMAYPIDSAYFPHRDELYAQLRYFQERGYYVGVHFYTNAWASATREAWELDAQLQAMRQSYGLGYGRMGVNQHTWFTSGVEARQSLLSAWEAGLLWNSGYAPANDPYPYPQASARNVLSLPFYLTVDGEQTILLQNCSTLLYADAGWAEISAKYDMPVCVYYHCDFTVGKPEQARADIETVEAFRQAQGYNFVMEDQLMLASAAAMNLALELRAGEGEGFDVTLTGAGVTNRGALYAGNYQTSCGARVSLGEALAGKHIVTDADVWYREGDELYVGLNRPVRVYEAEEAPAEAAHLCRINLPAAVSTTETGATVAFREGGLMQVAVRGEATTQSAGWEAVYENGETVFTRTGEAATVVIRFGG